MPRASKGARLVWRKESVKPDGSIRHRAGYFIRDGNRFISASRYGSDLESAQRFLADHLTALHEPARERGNDPAHVLIADVINVYARDIAPKHRKPSETASRLIAINDFFGDKTLADINGQLCRAYAAGEPEAAARRQLEDLRAAINHYHAEGYVTVAPKIVLPPKPVSRERWLTRDEAARLIWAAWTMRQTWKGQQSDRRTGRHVARFILVALYTGTRSAAVCGAAMRPTEGSGWIDLDRGVFHRRAAGARETKKRQPPVKLPDRLVAHIRRWARTPLEIKTKGRGKSANIGRMISQDHVVEWNGKPVLAVKKAFRAARIAAGLDDDVTPHVLRHTAATWLMEAGIEPWQAADFLGMSVQVLVSTYGHHHPDFQEDAAKAITSKRARPATRTVSRTDTPPKQSK